MKYDLFVGDPLMRKTDCLVIGLFAQKRLSGSAAQLDAATGGWLTALQSQGDLPDKPGQTYLLGDLEGMRAERVLLFGCGDKAKFNDARFQSSLRAAMARLVNTGAVDALLWLTAPAGRNIGWVARQSVLVAADQNYRFDAYRQQPKPQPALAKLALCVENRARRELARRRLNEGRAIAEGVALARNLANHPPNICTPEFLAEQAGLLEKESATLKRIEVIGPAQLEKRGMGALLAVARGSHRQPRLIAMEHRGRSSGAPVVLVGKGVTFDTGGISLKPAQDMDEMKFDMCGAAAVFGTLLAAARLRLRLNLVGIVPAVENMPGGGATRPGDIVTTMSGRTVEILNTDAEGRLILCDALTYCKKFKPRAVIDIATLTGACVVALGRHASGLFANYDPLARQLQAAGDEVCDRAWQLPLWEEYAKQLHSSFADIGNIGGREAGAATAAGFLSRFTEDYRWAHLDVAGTAWLGGKARQATGRPVPLLTQYLIERRA